MPCREKKVKRLCKWIQSCDVVEGLAELSNRSKSGRGVWLHRLSQAIIKSRALKSL